MELESAKKVPLNRITHSVRASQAVLQYGVGAMIDFPNQTLMTAAPEYWREQVVQIHDERLEKVLHVDYFGLPGGQDDPHCREGISYARFPNGTFVRNADGFSQSVIGFLITGSRQHKKDAIAIRIWLSLCNARNADKILWSRVSSLPVSVGTLTTSRGLSGFTAKICTVERNQSVHTQS